MLTRKFKRFIIFFSSFYLIYFIITTFHKTHQDHNTTHENEDEAFLVNSFRPINAQPKKFDTVPIPIPKYHHDDVKFVEDKDLLKQLQQQVQEASPIPHPSIEDDDKVHDISTTIEKDGFDKFQFFEILFDIYMNHFPQIPPIRRSDKDQLTAININDNDIIPSEEYLSNHLQISQDQFNELSQKHQSLLNLINSIKSPTNLYNGNGIVMVADTDENLLLNILIITILRNQLQSTIDVEMMFFNDSASSSSSHDVICNDLLSNLNVTCVPILQNFNTNITKIWNFKDSNLFKSLAILNSNFANVLYLDSTTFPVEDPILNFKRSPFIKYGLVLWPDYWKRMTSPIYYKIINKTIDMFRTRLSRNEFVKSLDETGFYDMIPFHDRGGTVPDGSSAGQIVLIDKFKHFKTLLLSLYYNINGDSFYYPMLTNLAVNIGGGEKETLATAANCLNVKFYQVKRTCQVVGSWFNSRFNGIGMKQYNAIKDFRNLIVYKRTRDDFDKQLSANKVAFISINNPNLNPVSLMNNFNNLKDFTDGSRIRLLGEDLTDIGYDLELISFQVFKNLICDSTQYEFSFIKNDRKRLCKFINLQLTFLKSTNKEVKLI